MSLRKKMILFFVGIVLISTSLMITGAIWLNNQYFENSLQRQFQVTQNLVDLSLAQLTDDWQKSLEVTTKNKESVRVILNALAANSPKRRNFFKFFNALSELSLQHGVAQNSIHFLSNKNPNFHLYGASDQDGFYSYSPKKNQNGKGKIQIEVNQYGLLLPKLKGAKQGDLLLPVLLESETHSIKLHAQNQKLYFDIHSPLINDSLGKEQKKGGVFIYRGLKYGVIRSFVEITADWLKQVEQQTSINLDIHLIDGTHGLGNLAVPIVVPDMHDSPIFYRTVDGQDYIGKIIPIRFLDKKVGYLVTSVPQSYLNSQLFNTAYTLAGLGLLTLVFSILLAFVLTHFLLRPILTLEQETCELAKGNLEKVIDTTGKDELGNLARSFAFMRDSIREKIEEIEEKNTNLKKADKLKDEFLANTSHELRTPLNGIIGLTESLLDGVGGGVNEVQAKNLKMVVHGSKRLSNLVNDILDYAKMKEQELDIDIKPVDIKSISDVICSLAAPLLGKKDTELNNQIPDNLPLVDADENRMQQILMNLVGNAIKFTHEGEVLLSAEQHEHQIKILVADTGIGIPPEKLKGIFNAFEQGDGSTAREYGGTGLGLSITRKLLELQGSSVAVESEKGKGSVFSFFLPISSGKPSEELSPPLESSSPLEPSTTPSTPLESSSSPLIAEERTPSAELAPLSAMGQKVQRILVVDDEPMNIQVLTNHLKLMNYDVLSAESGFQALEILQSETPDLVLLDLMMPRMNGYEVCQHIREKFDSSSVPIVMLTAKNQKRDLVQGLNSGANDYLVKPFDKEELLARIRNHLSLSFITKAYERFVPHEFLYYLEKDSIVDIELGNCVEMSMSVLFSDIRSFTTLSEEMTPEENFNFLNSYLGLMGPVIRENHGFIDKYIGDAIMALFEHQADLAVKAGIEMNRKIHEYNESRKKEGLPPIHIGIGINTGELMLGTLGEQGRMEGTVISDAVNLASRVENLTKMYGVSMLITDHTFSGLQQPSDYSFRPIDRVMVKGKKEVVTLYEIFDGDLPVMQEAKRKSSASFQAGLALYYAGQFEEAKQSFESCLAIYEDRVSRLYVERCEHYSKVGVDSTWKGVTQFEG